jgi:SAM-dependent methyltransferase
MAEAQSQYLLAGQRGELERLQLQARVLEPEAEAMLDQIGIRFGWHGLDLGCGAMGILGPLSRRVGTRGKVVGMDIDPKLLEAARMLGQDEGWDNVELREGDARQTRLAPASFDIVHARFLLAPLRQHEDELLREMLALTRPGGVVALQEPDASSWTFYPAHPTWTTFKEAIIGAYNAGGGDFNVGQRTYGLLRKAGLENVQIRAAVVALPPAHPFLRAAIQFATSLRQRIVEGGWLTEPALDEVIAACEMSAHDPETCGLSFVVTQVWGWKPHA